MVVVVAIVLDDGNGFSGSGVVLMRIAVNICLVPMIEVDVVVVIVVVVMIRKVIVQ